MGGAIFCGKSKELLEGWLFSVDSHSYFYLSSKALELELLFVINDDIVVIEKGVIS